MNNTKDELISILRSFLNKSYNYSLNCDINQLYELSCSLGVTGIVGYVLNKSGIKNDDFEKHVYKSLYKFERLNNAREQIDELLNDKYDYLYLKGLTISKYYDEPYLRISSDIDLIVKDNDYNDVYNYLLKNGFKFIRRDKQEITLSNNNGVIIDLHHKYTLNDDGYESLYDDCFNKTHELDINYNYVFNLMHCLKHFRSGILNYKFFIDLYYLRKNIDKNKVNDLLNLVNLSKFDESMNSYLDCLLGIKNCKENDLNIESFIFDYCKDSGVKNRVLINSYGKSRIEYLFSRIFIPFDMISSEYPILIKYKLLLPIYYIKRIIRIIKSKRGKYAYNELKNNSVVNGADIEKMHIFISEIGAI